MKIAEFCISVLIHNNMMTVRNGSVAELLAQESRNSTKQLDDRLRTLCVRIVVAWIYLIVLKSGR